jgi:hypothetical protein
MGFRDHIPGLNRFLTRDNYNGALADAAGGFWPSGIASRLSSPVPRPGCPRAGTLKLTSPSLGRED